MAEQRNLSVIIGSEENLIQISSSESESPGISLEMRHAREETGTLESNPVLQARSNILPDVPPLPVIGTGDDAFIKFQLIPISEVWGKTAVGEVVERKLKEGSTIKVAKV